MRFGVYRAVVRYIGLDALNRIIKGVVLTTLLLLAFSYLSGAQPPIPRTVYILFAGISVALIFFSRVFARWVLTQRIARISARSNVAIYGAGKTGRQLAVALSQSNEFRPVIFIDDDPSLHHREVAGLQVLAPERLVDEIGSLGVTRVLVGIESMTQARRREILAKLEPLPVKVLLMPDVDELATGNARISELREVEAADLLGRDAVEPNYGLFDTCITGKHVMVTGAGGSIGSELCRQIISRNPRSLVLLERSEFALYQIEKEILDFVGKNSLETKVVAALASVNDKKRLSTVIASGEIQTIYHAAAYKHVPMVESNPLDGISNNVFGTRYVLDAAVELGVETFVLVSTDKAVRPTNVMGATKRLAEMVVQGVALKHSNTRISIVRFGNVLASSGSVVPLFREQIKNGGPVTVTHRDVIRYFMTIPEAAQLVIQAGAMGAHGDVFVLDMGSPVRVIDLARRMIRLYGYRVKDEANPNGDIEIRVTGLRPGEKLYEELLIGDDTEATEHPRIDRAHEKTLEWDVLQKILDDMKEFLRSGDEAAALRCLSDSVLEYTPGAETAAKMARGSLASSHKNVIELSSVVESNS